jgi:pimeloyl-ACP methyl ester carboxylesterase
MMLAGYADALAELLAVLGVNRAHVGGLSWGGGLAIALYQHHPKLVRSLLLAGAYTGWKGSLPPEEVEAQLRRVRAEAERPPAEWMGDYLPTSFSRPAPPEAIDLIQMMMPDIRAAGLLPMLTAFADADLREVLPTIAVPTLLLWGEADARAPIRPVAEALLASIPGSELVVLPGTGHYINLAAPDAFNAEVRRFLGAVS